MDEGPMGRKMQVSVLIVDDNAQVRTLVGSIVGRICDRTMQASDGRQGLAEYKAKRPDLIITDMHMPNMSGLEMLVEVRKIDPEARAIVVSGNLPKDEEMALYDAGALAILSKPFKNSDLKSVVEYCLQGL